MRRSVLLASVLLAMMPAFAMAGYKPAVVIWYDAGGGVVSRDHLVGVGAAGEALSAGGAVLGEWVAGDVSGVPYVAVRLALPDDEEVELMWPDGALSTGRLGVPGGGAVELVDPAVDVMRDWVRRVAVGVLVICGVMLWSVVVASMRREGSGV